MNREKLIECIVRMLNRASDRKLQNIYFFGLVGIGIEIETLSEILATLTA